jgi:hypothetical protein
MKFPPHPDLPAKTTTVKIMTLAWLKLQNLIWLYAVPGLVARQLFLIGIS